MAELATWEDVYVLSEPVRELARREVARRAESPADHTHLLSVLGLDAAPQRPARVGAWPTAHTSAADCGRCGRQMVRKHPEGSQVAYGANGLCGSCYTRSRRPDATVLQPVFAALLNRPNWTVDARCAGDDNPDRWFCESGAAEDRLCTCEGCPVRVECAQFAVQENIAHGVWGGYRLDDRTERDALRSMYVDIETKSAAAPSRRRVPKCMVPAEPARHRYLALRAAKVPLHRIVADSGVCKTVLMQLARHDTTHIARLTEQRIMALPPPAAVTL